MSEPTVSLLPDGAILISDIVYNCLMQITYYGYTEEEALELFAKEVSA